MKSNALVLELGLARSHSLSPLSLVLFVSPIRIERDTPPAPTSPPCGDIDEVRQQLFRLARLVRIEWYCLRTPTSLPRGALGAMFGQIYEVSKARSTRTLHPHRTTYSASTHIVSSRSNSYYCTRDVNCSFDSCASCASNDVLRECPRRLPAE
ncbi:hypothetical protein BDV93DRAFT_564726 [Ceratobasidium sp. AG-I]|nr:hypothetical protein BDV93DRAFT_564726 [Ceratobasidium sp. AG-I]